MSVELRGVPAAPGVATGAPWIHHPPPTEAIPARPIADAAAEAADELAGLAARLREGGRPDEAGILDAQSLMAGDPELLDSARDAEAAGMTPVAAITSAAEAAARQLEELDDEVLSARAADVRDVAARIARHLVGAPPPRLERRSIAVAEDLAPSITVELDRIHLAGIALEGGSRTSHAAILARALGIPAVVGVAGLVARASGAAELAIDGDAGIAVLDPDAAALERLERATLDASIRREADAAFDGRPLATADGHRVVCAANIAEPAEAEAAFASGAEGIGLFRTEFAFAARVAAPSAEEQAAAYELVLRAAGDAPVVVRLADIGGDKPLPYVAIGPETNPFLGVRAIRLADAHPALFATQVRAILAASRSAGRPVAIMAPMVADVADARLVRQLVAEAREAVPDAPEPRIGIMVEVPAAVFVADQLAVIMDFMSIGTNDLTQYLLAADRGNPKLADRQDPLHPAVLRAVSRVVEGARASEHGCEVAVCGEMAGDPAGALLLVGLGVDELSMEPRAFNAVKRALSTRTRAELAELAVAAQSLTSASEVQGPGGSGMTSQPPPRIGSLANMLGIARIAATPVVIALMLPGTPGLGMAAFVVFVLAALTDFLDGWVARRRDEVSPLGVFMDLTADKVLVGGVLVAMVQVDLLPTWIVATIVVRELVIGGVRQMAAAENIVIAARPLGKAKTATTLAGMALLLLAYDAATGGPMDATGLGDAVELVGWWTMVVATVLTLVSAWDYLKGAMPLLRGQR